MLKERKGVASRKQRAWLGAVIALLCIQGWLAGVGHAYCGDALSSILGAVELEIIGPAIGLCVVACAGATAFIAAFRDVRWWSAGIVALGYAAVSFALLSTVELHDAPRYWIVGPALGSAVAVVAIGLCVPRLPPFIATILGVGTSIACFAVTYALTAFTGATPCFFAP